MPHFVPTAEQVACVDAATASNRNLLISALAGAAKTSTLVLIAEALRTKSIQAISFNVRIAKEMKDRLPPNCESSTLNSIGHRAWGATLGRRLVVNKDKNYQIVQALGEELDRPRKSEFFEIFSDLIKALDRAKVYGWVPDGVMTERAKPLLDNMEFFASLPEEPSELMEALLIEGMRRSITQAYSGTIDYSDQLFMPAVFPCNFHQFPVTLVDESQDLSELNHVLLRKMVRANRLIAVGDECQSIYAFRGADITSMATLQQAFDMDQLTLSTTFRCPIKVVEESRWRAPHMRWPEWAKEGEVKHFTDWGHETLPHNAVIICRNNAPLFSMAIRLLKAGRAPELVGNDIGKGLVKIMKKFGSADMSRDQVLQEIASWREAKLKKSREAGAVHDRAECMEVFAMQGETLGDAIAYAEHVFACGGPIKLMTGHKSKGLEFDNVFLLDTKLLRLDQQQERNLKYVMQTRAKAFLGYIDSEAYIDV